MIPPAWVKETAHTLRASGIRTASFVDFPYGTMTSAGKAYEAARLVEAGAEEVDLMPNVGFLLSGMEREYADDIEGVVTAAGKAPVKIMLELPLLTEHHEDARARSERRDRGCLFEEMPAESLWGLPHRNRSRFYAELLHRMWV